MKRIMSVVLLSVLSLVLVGCPANSTQRQNVAQAAQTASSVVKAAQTAEITAHEQGQVTDADHQFIEKEFLAVSIVGKTLDSCIGITTSTAGDLACISTATAQLDQINNDGGLYIKSDQAKQTFQATMAALKVALVAISQVLGGK